MVKVLSPSEIWEAIDSCHKGKFDEFPKWKQAALEAWWLAHCTCKNESLVPPKKENDKGAHE